MRSNALKKLTLLRKDHGGLEAELAAYGDSNPAKVEELKRAAFLGKEAAYRWTGSFLSLLLVCEEHDCKIYRQLRDAAWIFYKAKWDQPG